MVITDSNINTQLCTALAFKAVTMVMRSNDKMGAIDDGWLGATEELLTAADDGEEKSVVSESDL